MQEQNQELRASIQRTAESFRRDPAMRTILQLLVVTLSLTSTAGRADACSCRADSSTEEVQIKREFDDASVVVVARLVSIKQTFAPDAPKYVTEDAGFVVLEVLKGNVVTGQMLRIRSLLGPGPCGRSAQNNPAWLEEVRAVGEPTKPAAVSKEWLIYGRGAEPYELSLCDRSMPLSHRGASDVRYLRALPRRERRNGI